MGNGKDIAVTGSGALAPEPLGSILGGIGASADVSAAADVLEGHAPEPPEITAFEIPQGAPAFGFEVVDFELSKFVPSIKSYIDRCSALALGAARLTLDRAGLAPDKPRPAEIGLVYATTFGCLDSMELFWQKVKGGNPKFAPPLPFTHAYANSPSSILAIEFKLRGHAITFSGDVSSGLLAVAQAASAIRGGAASAVLAGASEALSAARWRHHWSEGELSLDGKWVPLAPAGSANGIVPGEGAAFVLLETLEGAAARNADVESVLAGWALSPFGGTKSPAAALQEAARRALEEAGVAPKQVGLVCLASPEPDALAGSEREAIGALFGSHCPLLCAPKWAGGEALSVSPAFAIVQASGCLSGRVLPAPCVDPCGAAVKVAGERPDTALVHMLDPWGQAGAAVLKRRDLQP